MRLYLVNIDVWVLPERGIQLLRKWGFDVGGNWLPPPFHREPDEFSPDVVVYAPHRRVDALVLHKKDLLRTPHHHVEPLSGLPHGLGPGEERA